MWGSAPRPGRGLPQPQSSSRALPCPPVAQSRLLRYRLQPRFRCPAPGRFAASRQQATGLTLPSALVSVDSYGSLCASRKCPQGTRSPPSPCTPFLGLRPKGDRVWWVILALALRTHLGLRPKPRASRLARSPLLLEVKLRKRGGGLRHLTECFNKLRPPRFRGGLSVSKKLVYGDLFRPLSVLKPLARGLGRSPKWVRKAKAGRTRQTLAPLGRSPKKRGAGG